MGKNISQHLKHAVEMFYQSDKFSKMHPREKEYVSVKIDGVKQHKQKKTAVDKS